MVGKTKKETSALSRFTTLVGAALLTSCAQSDVYFQKTTDDVRGRTLVSLGTDPGSTSGGVVASPSPLPSQDPTSAPGGIPGESGPETSSSPSPSASPSVSASPTMSASPVPSASSSPAPTASPSPSSTPMVPGDDKKNNGEPGVPAPGGGPSANPNPSPSPGGPNGVPGPGGMIDEDDSDTVGSNPDMDPEDPSPNAGGSMCAADEITVIAKFKCHTRAIGGLDPVQCRFKYILPGYPEKKVAQGSVTGHYFPRFEADESDRACADVETNSIFAKLGALPSIEGNYKIRGEIKGCIEMPKPIFVKDKKGRKRKCKVGVSKRGVKRFLVQEFQNELAAGGSPNVTVERVSRGSRDYDLSAVNASGGGAQYCIGKKKHCRD